MFLLQYVLIVLFASVVIADSYIYTTDGTPTGKDVLFKFADLHQYTVEPLYPSFDSPYYVVNTPAVKNAKLFAAQTPLHAFAAAQKHGISVPISRKLDAMNRYSNPYAIPYVEVERNFYVPSALNRNVMHLNASNVRQTGAGVRVYIPDGGMQCDHAAFARKDGKSSCNAAAGMSTCSDAIGTKPEGPLDVHATMCASVICASKFGGGIAPNAICIPRRYICDGGWSTIAEARANAVAEMAVMSVSNGPPDGIHYYEFPPPELVHGIVETWNRGVMRVDAAGNGAIRGETCAADWTVSLQQTPGVGAITASGMSEEYSEKCPGVLVSAFGASGSNVIYTALADPYSTNTMSNLFDGTSAAAPQVAGVIALLREALPNIQPRDIVRALAATSRKEGLVAGRYPFISNAAGFSHSLAFGFGYPDTYALIQFANATEPLPAQKTCTETILDLSANADLAYSTFEIAVPKHCEINFIENVEMQVSFLFDSASDMGELSLSSPSGRTSVFLDSFHGYVIDRWNLKSGGWPWMGETAAGTWTLSVEALDNFNIAAVTITIYGAVL